MTAIRRSAGRSSGRVLRLSGFRTTIAWILLLAPVAAGCGDDDPVGPGPGVEVDLVTLNSTGQTLAPFRVSGSAILSAGIPVDLGAGFDGVGVALHGSIAASTVSSFGGSRIVLVDLSDGSVGEAVFPGPDPTLVNPSRASFDPSGVLWVGGRGSDAVYRLAPGSGVAESIATDVGTFVERVVPVGDELFAIDANIDDDGGTYEPLGRGRVVVLDRLGAPVTVVELPVDAPNPADALLARNRLIVLAGGTFDPITFAPNSDGALVIIDPGSRRVVASRPLGANGVSLSLGADGNVYVTTTEDYLSLALLRFDPITGSFDRGPSNPIDTRDESGSGVDCWTATALLDGRIVCSTFRTDAPGRLLLLGPEGAGISETGSGFGTTDIGVRG